MNIRTTVIGGISLLLLVSCSQRRSQQNESPEREYPVMVVEKQDAELQSVYPVTLRGKEDAEIKPRVSGYIDKVYIDEGAYVKKGQALFSVNSPTSEHDLASAKAALETAEANLNTARLDVDRIRPLADKNIVSTVQLETYENAYKASQASKSEAEVALKAAQATTGWTTVTSPIEGVVGSIPYRSGNMVTGATTLTTISNVETVYAYFSINEKAFSALLSTLEGNSMGEKIGNIPEATLTLADGTVYPEKGKVSTISGIVNQATGSVNLRVAFPNEQGVLRSGASGKVSIPRKVGNVFVIPQKSTFAQQDKIVLYKVVNDSTVQSIVQVDPLPDGKNYVVTQGLEEGDRIVLDGIATLRNAQKIK
ncbi:MAG TPA: efflux RND transporter periplasmic adaptor subunit, partial [Porphyromonadaceae bacterium]|nr:efflux RND transporter periplasmic adaptor subunit [Porphyromonadaceae bacterium]